MNQFKKLSIVCFAALIISSCTTKQNYDQHAQKLAHKFVIADGHIDVPYRLRHHWEDISKSAPKGEFDFPRAQEGGLDAPFMSIYIPVEYQKTGGAKALADSLINMVEGLASDHPNKFALAKTPAQIKEQFQQGLISLPMGMENGAPVQELSDVKYFYDRGIRYITLAHAKDNRLSDSSYDTTKDTHNGLSNFGKQVVREMNRYGIMVDVSHITDEAFDDVMAVSEAPVIASHSSCRHFTPDFERNMSDAMIQRLADNDGVIMINFGSTFLDSASSNSMDQVQAEIDRQIKENGWDPSGEKAEEFRSSYFQEHFNFSSVQKVADHIDHVVDLVGIDHVGLGSDFDGVGPTLPNGLKDVSAYPNLIAELLKRGYTEEEIQKICSGNVFRVWNKVIDVANAMPSTSES